MKLFIVSGFPFNHLMCPAEFCCMCSAFQLGPHGGVLCDAGSAGDAGPELAHCV